MPYRVPFILIQLGSQAQKRAGLPFNSLGVGGGDSQLLGGDQSFLGGGPYFRAGYHRGVSMQWARKDLGNTLFLLLLPQTLDPLCLCFLYSSLVPSTKSLLLGTQNMVV